MKYKYVFFDSGELNNGLVDTTNYYYVCTLDLRKTDGVKVISYPTEGRSSLYHKLFVSSLLLSKKYPFLSFLSRLFFPSYFPDEYENEEEFTEAWENLSEEDAQELKKLEIQSEKEYEQWLKQQKLQEKRKQQEENLRKKMKEDEEKQKTQELLEQMMKAENERRQKLLEDVQNSLQGNDSTNVSSGADDIIDLNYEGELD